MSYINPHSMLGIGIFFPVLGALLLAGRFWVRHHEKIRLGIDDWLCIPAWLLMSACGIINIIGFATKTIGFTTPVHNYKYANALILEQAKLKFAFQAMLPLALGFIKLAILFFYRRIFRGKAFQICNWTLIFLVVAWTVTFFFGWVFACGAHVSRLWTTLAQPEDGCINSFKLSLAQSIIDVVTDFFMYLLPIPLIWRLHLPLRIKAAVSAVFLLGLLALIAGILRLVVFVQILGAGHAIRYLHILGHLATDEMVVVSTLLFWPMIEMGVAFTVACMPSLRPAFRAKSLENALRSVRSKLSLRSTTSQGGSTSSSQDQTIQSDGFVAQKA